MIHSTHERDTDPELRTEQSPPPVWLGGDLLLVLYNRRYGKQGIVMLVVRVA